MALPRSWHPRHPAGRERARARNRARGRADRLTTLTTLAFQRSISSLIGTITLLITALRSACNALIDIIDGGRRNQRLIPGYSQ